MKKIGIASQEVDGNKKAIAVSLAFRVVPAGDGLYSAQMLFIEDDVIVDRRTGVGTTLGHAIAAADDMLDGWAFSEIETKAEDFFQMVLL